MYIPDVEELFELVNVGTPVSIYAERPSGHRKYVLEKKKETKENPKEEKDKESKPGA
jgi:hypothetical protein